MSTNWTIDQEKAIHTTGQNLLVSAAAGSGKTAVLAARCAYLVCDALDPCDVTELLVVTFTNAAADEMKKRIANAIAQKAIGSDSAHLQRQMLLAGAAQISTIHSLGQSIIRRHFHELGVDPAFRLLDQDEARLLRAELVDDLLESRFDDETATDFRKLVDLYGNGIPHAVAGLVLGLHAKLSSLIDRDAWLRDRRAKLVEAAEKPLNQSEIGKAVIEAAREQIRTLADSAARLSRVIDTHPSLGAYGVHVRGIEAHLRGWEESIGVSSWDALAADIVTFKPETIPRLKPSPEKEAMQARINDLKDRIKSFIGGGLFAFTEGQLRDGVQSTIWVTDQITSLVTDFESAYTAAKREAGALDFNDLEHLALRLLQVPGSNPPAPSRIAREYQRQFRYVMVDEYQDVNQVQDTLLSLLGRDHSHFAVGDVKQSIYRFRQADPRRFIDRYVRYKKEKPAPGSVIDLQKNFRSRAPLLEALNGVFESLMTKESAEVAYSATQRLVPGATYAEGNGLFVGTPIELHVIEKQAPGSARDYDNDEREAIIAVTRIRDLVGRSKVANRDGSSRPLEYRDVVILLRTMRIKAEHFATILRRAGIPVQADSSSGYFAATEIGDMLSVLKLLASSRDDIALAAFLRSPLSGWSDAEDKLAQIRLAYPTKVCPCFHQAFEQYRIEKDDELAHLIRATSNQLNQWRQLSQNKPVADVLWAILEDTSYLAYISGLPDGEQRVANVMDLHSRARQFEAFQRPTVARFLAFLDSLQEDGDLGMPAAAGVAQNAVRIMSIHKSKGLEFPVVILPDLGKAHNLRDATDKLLFDDAVGIAARAVDAEKEVHYATLATTLAAHEIRRKQIAEELRVLYVAGTRAKEHLILIGTAAEGCFTDWDDSWSNHAGPIPAGDVRDAGTMLAWVGPAISIVETSAPGSFDRNWHAAADVDAEAERMLPFRAGDTIPATIAGLKPLQSTPPRSGAVAAAIARLEQTYAFKPLTTIPAVTSVTASTKSGRTAPGGKSVSTSDVVSFENELRLPRALAERKVLTPADRGTITHAVLQRIDLSKARDATSLESELTSLVGRRFLSGDDLSNVDRGSILWLLNQPLGQALASAKDLRRELSITYTEPVRETVEDASDLQMVRGRLDAVIVEDDGLTIVDYKTDNVTADTVNERAAFYGDQIAAYRTQLENLTGHPVKATHLVFMTLKTIVAV